MSDLCQSTLEEAEYLIPAFQVVSKMVLRGGQPDQEGLALLKRAGVKTIVNLRHSAKNSPNTSTSFFRRRGDDDEIDEEREIAQRLGMQFINISLDGTSTPAIEDLQRFTGLFQEESNWPVFVHCLYGRERTSLMVGCYRVGIEGWTAEQAYKEMVQTGLDPARTVLTDALFAFAK